MTGDNYYILSNTQSNINLSYGCIDDFIENVRDCDENLQLLSNGGLDCDVFISNLIDYCIDKYNENDYDQYDDSYIFKIIENFVNSL